MAEDLNVPQQSMTIFNDGSFFQSPLFTSLLLATVTLIVGYVTYRIYKLQQKQVDRDAATIIYLQIKEFESRKVGLMNYTDKNFVKTFMPLKKKKQEPNKESWLK